MTCLKAIGTLLLHPRMGASWWRLMEAVLSMSQQILELLGYKQNCQVPIGIRLLHLRMETHWWQRQIEACFTLRQIQELFGCRPIHLTHILVRHHRRTERSCLQWAPLAFKAIFTPCNLLPLRNLTSSLLAAISHFPGPCLPRSLSCNRIWI